MKEYVNDRDIRPALREGEFQKFKRREYRIIHELGIVNGISFVDVAVLGPEFHAYEIKGERDRLNRLIDNQAIAYGLVFDFMTLVLHVKHYDEFRAVRKQYKNLRNWGLILAAGEPGDVSLRTVRKPLQNDWKPESLCSMLWREEILWLFKKYQIRVGVSKKNKGELNHCLADCLDRITLKHEVRRAIWKRKYWRDSRGN